MLDESEITEGIRRLAAAIAAAPDPVAVTEREEKEENRKRHARARCWLGVSALNCFFF